MLQPQSIDVDQANAKYVDVDGVVYDIDMKTVLHYPPAKAVPSYEIPDTVTSIGPAAFATGFKIGAVTIPDSVTVISDNAFEKCEGLTSIKIPNTVTSIGKYAFNSCEHIETVDFSGTTVLKSNGNGAFLDNAMLKTVEIPACVESLGERVFAACSSLETISIDPANEHYTTKDGILYDKSMETLMQFPGGCKMTSFTVPSTVKKINVNAFSSLTAMESLTFPDSVTTISDGACTNPSYLHMPLLKISFGKGLTTITGEHPFISHVFLDKNGKELQQTAENLKGHTFAGKNTSHMYMDDGKSSEGFPIWAIAAIAIAILAAIVGFVLWKRSR